MKTTKPIFWRQGLFLQPQHFQLSDLYQSSLLRPLQVYGQQHFWGLADLEIRQAGLGAKQFEIVRGEFVFPDGAYASFPGNAVIQPRSFDEAWVEGDKAFTVFLGLRKWGQTGGNATVLNNLDEASGATTRFVTLAQPEEVEDLHGDGPTAQVQRLDHLLRIFWENEKDQLANYHIIPVAQLERDGDEIILSKRFVAPCLSVNTSENLVKLIKDIRDQVSSRCRQLEEYKSPRELQSMDFDIGYMVFLLALRSLNRYVPLLVHLTEAVDVHPWTVYGAFRQLIGELSTFSEGLTASGEREDGTMALPPYNHQNLWQCFSSAQALIGQLLDSITVGPEHLVRLEFDGKYYTAELPQRIFDGRNRFWMVLRTQAEREFVLDSVSRVVKLSAARNLTTLIARAVPGIPLEHFTAPPPGLPRRANSFYYQIDSAGPQWSDVQKAQSISLYWDNAPEDLIAEIIILRS